MAGLRDYQEYMPSQGEESPFWERTGHQSSSSTSATSRRRRRRNKSSIDDEVKPSDDTLPPQHSCAVPATMTTSSPSADDAVDQYVTVACNLWGMLTDHVLVHPLLVLRRQCQINGRGRCAHLTPLSLPLVVYALQRRQGPAALYKGLGSALLTRSASLATEDVLRRVADCPRDVAVEGAAARAWGPAGLCRLGQQTALRAAAALLVWPLAAASFSETVQSSVVSGAGGGGAGGPLELLAEGGRRAACWLMSSRAARFTRQLPAWRVAPLAALHAAAVHVLATLGTSAIYWLLQQLQQRRRHQLQHEIGRLESHPGGRHRQQLHRRQLHHRHHHLQQQQQHQEQLDGCWHQLAAAAGGRYLAELLLYPGETVLVRLQTQGTRALVDSLDTSMTTSGGLGQCGKVVVAVSSRYEGALDCWSSVLREEGSAGLYRGVGALLAQACVHMALLYVGRAAIWQARSWLAVNKRGGVRLGGDEVDDSQVSMSSVAAGASPVKESRQTSTPSLPSQSTAVAVSPVNMYSLSDADDDNDNAADNDGAGDGVNSSSIAYDESACVDDGDDDIPAMTMEEWRRIYGRRAK